MTAAPVRLVLASAWILLAPAFAAALPVVPDAKSLAVRVSWWAFPSRPVAITVDQGGLLAGRHLTLYVFVDGDQVERVLTKADRTHARIRVVGLSAGRHLLTVRSGTEAAEVEFRVLPWSSLAGGGVLLLAGLAFILLRIRHERRRARDA